MSDRAPFETGADFLNQALLFERKLELFRMLQNAIETPISLWVLLLLTFHQVSMDTRTRATFDLFIAEKSCTNTGDKARNPVQENSNEE